MTYELATPLTQQVLKRRRLKGELGPCVLDAINRDLYRLSVYRPVLVTTDQVVTESREPVRQEGA